MLDGDIVEHFQKLASPKDAPKYQTQINAVLRKFVDGTLSTSEGLAKQIAKEVVKELKGQG
jgi:hypothetical protein